MRMKTSSYSLKNRIILKSRSICYREGAKTAKDFKTKRILIIQDYQGFLRDLCALAVTR